MSSQQGSGSPPALRPGHRASATRPPATKPAAGPKSAAVTSPGEIDSLEQMLEPERTGLHKREGGPPWGIIIGILVLLMVGAGVVVFVVLK
jgi:hypothetical protein